MLSLYKQGFTFMGSTTRVNYLQSLAKQIYKSVTVQAKLSWYNVNQYKTNIITL